MGPFLTYVPPGVYTRTLTEANVANIVAGLRIPFVIGVGQETLSQDNVELVRGSSATLDEQIVNEDVSLEWVVNATNPHNLVLGAQNGTYVTFEVRNYPITDGTGIGRVTNNPTTVSVTVNGVPVSVAQVNGAAGTITLQVPTQPTDHVLATYYFHRGDTAFTDDVSAQVTSTNATLISPGYEPYAITTGQNDTFSVLVNGITYSVVFPQGALTTSNLVTILTASAIPNLLASVFTDNDGLNHLQLTAPQSVQIGTGDANGPLGWVSGTKTHRNATFRVFNIPIVDGTGGGITTTNTANVVVKVNATQVIPTAVDGANGLVTLGFAPAPSSTVTIQYFANTWQNTFDYLPNSLVTTVLSCGIAPNRSDYIQNVDFTVSNPTADTSIVAWGVSNTIAAGSTSTGGTQFNGSQITGLLVDQKMWLGQCTAVTNTTVIPAVVSTTQFVLPEIPTTGNGRNSTLGPTLFATITNGRQDLITNRPDLVTVYAGRGLRDALNRPVQTVTAVNGATATITLANPIPPDWTCYATFYYNDIVDDTYILTCTVPGPVGTGQYTVTDSASGQNLYQIRFGVKTGISQVIQWPRGAETIPDAFMTGSGTPVSEVVTVTFSDKPAANAAFTNHNAQPYSFFSPYSATWVTNLNGTPVTTNLAAAARGYIVSGHVTPAQSGPSVGDVLLPVNALQGTFTVSASPDVTASVSQTGAIFPGSMIVFASQPASLYTVLSVAGTAIVLTGSYTGGAGTTTATTGGTLNLLIDNVAVTTYLDPGYTAPAAIVASINAAIDANAAFSGTAPNNLAQFAQIGPSTGDIFFVVSSYSTPGSLPGGFDNVSSIKVNQGTVETYLGFKTYQNANGTPGAINKPATVIGTQIGPFNITTGLNDVLVVTVNGIQYTITLPGGSAVTASTVVSTINGTPGLSGVASAGTLGNVNKVRLTSPTNDATSAILLGNGTANAVLGFTTNQFASQTQVTAQEVVDEMLSQSFISDGAIAYPDVINGGTYLTFESLTVGASASSIGFLNSLNSAFNPTTNIGLTPGVDGANGENVEEIYTVTSSAGASGSGGVGVPGQTYTDVVTGLRFTILPAQTGSYDLGHFTMTVSQTFAADPSRPFYSVAGLETTVSNTVGVVVGDTGTIQTFNPSGVTPAIGDFYYISYQYMKQDFAPAIYRQLTSIESAFGTVSATNRVSLAAYLAILNGALLVGVQQVLAVPNTNQASDASFIAAIQGLQTPLPGNIKPDIITPLGTSTAIYAYLTQSCEVMSTIQNQSERLGFIGFASGTVPQTAQSVAQSLVSSRIVAMYPDSSIITLTDELGNATQVVVDGTFFAAAVSGAVVSPSVDVATPYTRRRLQGFTSIPRVLDPITANQTAVAGVTLIDDLGNGFLRIRQGLTTNMSSILTRLPSVTQIADFVQQQSRAALDQYVGTKFLSTRTNEVNVTMTSLFKQLVQAEIVGAFTGISSNIDPDDPTILQFEAYYQPIFPLEYLVLTFNLRAQI